MNASLRLNARKLCQEIQAQGYQGRETQMRDFIQPYRAARQAQASVRYETEPGEQAQVDWGHLGLIHHNGCQRKLYAFVLTLGWSRALYIEFTIWADAARWLAAVPPSQRPSLLQYPEYPLM
jgi:transposase